MRSPSALENARFFAESGGGESLLVSYCLSGVHKNWYIIRAMRQNSKKRIDKSLVWVYPRVVKWIHYHRLDIKIKKTLPRLPEVSGSGQILPEGRRAVRAQHGGKDSAQ